MNRKGFIARVLAALGIGAVGPSLVLARQEQDSPMPAPFTEFHRSHLEYLKVGDHFTSEGTIVSIDRETSTITVVWT